MHAVDSAAQPELMKPLDACCMARPVSAMNEAISVSRGPHRITLGVPINYEPSFRKPTVVNTTASSPLEIEFIRIEE